MSLPIPSLSLQTTLARAVECAGVGLHGGELARVRILPAQRRAGIVYRRVDLSAGGVPVEISASLEGVSRVDHATTLSADTGAGRVSVSTVEHLNAALRGLGIDSCTVEVDRPEVPILDGSSAPWVALLKKAGRRTLPRGRRHMRIVRPKTVTLGDSSISCYPADDFRVTCAIDFAHAAIGRQEISLTVTPQAFERELAAARTFGFLHEVEALRAAGLARGGSLENALVVGDEGVVNGPLRFPDEFVRHKALDLVGDLALLGMPLAGHFVARRAGHRLHVEFARELLADESAYVIEQDGAQAPEVAAAMLAGAELSLPSAQSVAE